MLETIKIFNIKKLLSYKIVDKKKYKIILLKGIRYSKEKLYDNSTDIGFKSFLPHSYLQNLFYHKKCKNKILSDDFIREIDYKIDENSDYFGYPYDLFGEIINEEKIDKFFIKGISVLRRHSPPVIDSATLRFLYIEIYTLKGKLIYKGGVPIKKIPKYLRKQYKDLIENKITFKEFSSLKNRLLYLTFSKLFKNI